MKNLMLFSSTINSNSAPSSTSLVKDSRLEYSNTNNHSKLLSPSTLQPMTSNIADNQPTTSEGKPLNSSEVATRLQPLPPTSTGYPINTNPSLRSTTSSHPTFHSSFPIMPNNFIVPPLFSSSSTTTLHTHPQSSSLSSLTMNINQPSLIPSKPTSSLDGAPKPVPTASSILAPSLSLIDAESASPQPIRVSTILSSFNNTTTPSSQSYNSNSNLIVDTCNSMINNIDSAADTTKRIRKPVTPKTKVQTSSIVTDNSIKQSEPTTPNKEYSSANTIRNEAETPSNPFSALYSKPLSSFPLHHPSTSGSVAFLPFPSSSQNVSSPSTSPSPISLWPSTTTSGVPTMVNTTKPPPLPPPLKVSPSTKKRKVASSTNESQDSIGASLQPLTPLTPPTPKTPTHQLPFPPVRIASSPSTNFVLPPPFPISTSASLGLTTPPSNSKQTPTEKKMHSSEVPTLDLTQIKSKKRDNVIHCNNTKISFKSWMRTLDTLSTANLKVVQERVKQLLEKREVSEKQGLKKSGDEKGGPFCGDVSDETLSLLSTNLSSIDTLAILALADTPPSPNSKNDRSPEKSALCSDDSEDEFSEDEEVLINRGIRVEPFIREYEGNGFVYPGRRGAKSQRLRLPLCFFPSMKLVMVADSGPDTFIEGDEIVNPVIDLEHHLEYFIPDSNRELYSRVKAFKLSLLKRLEKNYYVEESSILVQRSAKSEEGGYNFSLINQTEPEFKKDIPSDYSILLIEARGKRRTVVENDKVNRYCEIIYDQSSSHCKFRVGFRICKAQKKKHTKGIYMLRLTAYLSEDDIVVFNSINQPNNAISKVLEESDMFKIVSRRATVERTRINRTITPNASTNNLKRKKEEEEESTSD